MKLLISILMIVIVGFLLLFGGVELVFHENIIWGGEFEHDMFKLAWLIGGKKVFYMLLWILGFGFSFLPKNFSYRRGVFYLAILLIGLLLFSSNSFLTYFLFSEILLWVLLGYYIYSESLQNWDYPLRLKLVVSSWAAGLLWVLCNLQSTAAVLPLSFLATLFIGTKFWILLGKKSILRMIKDTSSQIILIFYILLSSGFWITEFYAHNDVFGWEAIGNYAVVIPAILFGISFISFLLQDEAAGILSKWKWQQLMFFWLLVPLAAVQGNFVVLWIYIVFLLFALAASQILLQYVENNKGIDSISYWLLILVSSAIPPFLGFFSSVEVFKLMYVKSLHLGIAFGLLIGLQTSFFLYKMFKVHRENSEKFSWDYKAIVLAVGSVLLAVTSHIWMRI